MGASVLSNRGNRLPDIKHGSPASAAWFCRESKTISFAFPEDEFACLRDPFIELAHVI
jgi:hypothetical protein